MVLWTMPYLRDETGKVVHHLAVGPAGQPVDPHLIVDVDIRHVPDGTSVKVVMTTDREGRQVFDRPNHTLN